MTRPVVEGTPGPDALDVASGLAGLSGLEPGTGYADAVHRMLAVVRTQLGMQMAWVTDFVGDEQVFRYVDAEPGSNAPSPGTRMPMSGTFCARVLDGRFPGLIPDARAVPEAALLNATADLRLEAYVGVPLLGPHGVPVGMLCASSDAPMPGLNERDLAAVRLLAQLLHDVQQRAQSEAQAVADRDRVRRALLAVVEGRGRHAVLQPVVEIATGRAVAAEGLTRFTAASPLSGPDGVLRSPAQWFDDAARHGLRPQLELATAAAVLDLLPTTPPEVALTVNLGPETLVSDALEPLLDGRPLDRVVVELTEHAPVCDYEVLARALAPYRAAGLRVAVDDAGAGYASLQHVLAVHPDLVKVDMALTRGSDADLARRTLLTALAGFARATGCRLVAEGVESAQELDAVAGCGVELAQGYYLGRPSPSPAWSGFPTA